MVRLFSAILCVLMAFMACPEDVLGQHHHDSSSNTKKIEIRMPGVEPTKDDDYLCSFMKLDPEEAYITKFTVEGTAERAHHMILMGCPEVKSSDGTSWSCANHGACTGGSSILFAWAKNAPGATLPKDVGFRISGPRSKVKYLVLQVHYAHKLAPGVKDYSGIDIEVTYQPQRYIAGILLMMAMPTIPPFQKKFHADSYCPVDVPAPAKIFAFRVHAHALGTVITGYRISPKTNVVEEIARGNPQWPQAFYSTKKQFDLEKGDSLLARCTYDSSDRNTTTETGATANDEMCNLYLMYYTDAEKGSPYQSCSYLPGERERNLFPADSDEPLPPNPVLEAYALHGNKKSKQPPAEQQDEPQHEDHAGGAIPAGDQLSETPMDLNRVYYKHVFDGVHHHQHSGHEGANSNQPGAQPNAAGGVAIQGNNGQQVTMSRAAPASSSVDRDIDFLAFLQFYRQFFLQQ